MGECRFTAANYRELLRLQDVTQSTRSKAERSTFRVLQWRIVPPFVGLAIPPFVDDGPRRNFPVKPVKFGRQWRFPKSEVDRMADWWMTAITPPW